VRIAFQETDDAVWHSNAEVSTMGKVLDSSAYECTHIMDRVAVLDFQTWKSDKQSKTSASGLLVMGTFTIGFGCSEGDDVISSSKTLRM
jgi:hypothetical protein